MKKLIVYMFFVLSSPIYAASFDCSLKLNNVEKLICGSQQVSALDEKLSDVYGVNKKTYKNLDYLRNDQRHHGQWSRSETHARHVGNGGSANR